MITRMMVNSAVFVELADVQDSCTGVGISRRRMCERLKEVLNLREALDPCEVEQLVDYCFRSVVHKESTANFLTEIADKVKHRKPSDIDAGEIINIDEFSVACSSIEKVKFATIVTLFDADRQRTSLERLFTPYMFKRYIRHSHKLDRASLDLSSNAMSGSPQNKSSHNSGLESSGRVSTRLSCLSASEPMTMEEEKFAHI